MTATRRWAIVGGFIVVAVVAFVIAQSGSNSSKSSSKVVHLVVKGGKPVGGIKKIEVAKGKPVRFDVTSDVADEIHVHGYNFKKDVSPGHPASFDFPAKIDGVFVIELESRGEQIASLEVTP
jgi:heme/copper-type cytochrome/quinol oxidase subunit 2